MIVSTQACRTRAAAALGAVALAAALLAGCGSSGSAAQHSHATSPPTTAASQAGRTALANQPLTVHAVVQHTHGTVAVFVPITVHGKPYYFVLDSGATVSVLDTSLAKSAALPTSSAGGSSKTIGCTEHNGIAQISDWSLGSTALPPARLPTQNLGFGKLKINGRPVGGLFGADALTAVGRVRIDYRTGMVTLHASAPRGGDAVKLRTLPTGPQDALIAPVRIEGHVVPMVVDTGASRTALQATTATSLKLAHAGSRVSVNAAGCKTSAQPVRLADASIGGRHLPDAVIVATTRGSPYGSAVPGAFGSDLLSTFGTITLDFPKTTLTLGA
jgi:Predicted aspartyl protease